MKNLFSSAVMKSFGVENNRNVSKKVRENIASGGGVVWVVSRSISAGNVPPMIWLSMLYESSSSEGVGSRYHVSLGSLVVVVGCVVVVVVLGFCETSFPAIPPNNFPILPTLNSATEGDGGGDTRELLISIALGSMRIGIWSFLLARFDRLVFLGCCCWSVCGCGCGT